LPPSTPEQKRRPNNISEEKQHQNKRNKNTHPKCKRTTRERQHQAQINHQPMKTEHWKAACLQETWRLESDDIHTNDYRLFIQGNSMKTNTKGCVMGGECIILSPTFDKACKKLEMK
jgi:hypothetical protein